MLIFYAQFFMFIICYGSTLGPNAAYLFRLVIAKSLICHPGNVRLGQGQ
jgi:hypothetical protein